MLYSGFAAQFWGFFPKSFNSKHIFVTLIVGIFISILFTFLKYAFKRHSLSKHLPGEQYRFFDIFATLSEIENVKKSTKNFNVALLKVIQKYAKKWEKQKMFCLWITYVPFLLIIGAKPLEDLIAGTRTLKKGWNYMFLHPWLGTGLLTSFGKKWKTRRKLLTPSFHFEILKDFLPIFNEQSRNLVEILKREETKEFTDITMPVTLCSLDIICETTLGVRISAQENKDSEYVKAVLRVSTIIAERMVNFKYWIDPIFKLTEAGRQHTKDLKLLHEFTRSVIREKKQKLLCGYSEALEKKKRKALMDVLLEHQLRTKELSEEDIREEVDTFTFEGHDTTSMGMSWALYLIGLYKKVQDKLHQEIDGIFGDDIEREVTTDDLRDLQYLDRVLKESQRLYPSVPLLSREATEDIIISGYKVPRGTICVGATYQLHRDEEVFPDPEKFDPDRFLPENSVNRHPFAYVPFSAGPRNCIGQRFAVMEVKVVVCSILRNFRLESLDTRDKLTPSPELILRPIEPIRIKLRPRRL